MPYPPLDVLILAGGLGTRLASTVPHLPKVLAPIGNVPFLTILLRQLFLSQGMLSRIFFALGHKASYILSFLETISSPIPLIPLQEDTPLGTGGALLNAYPHTSSNTLLVLNGDSFFDLPLETFLQFHHTQNGQATLATRHVDDTRRYGLLQLDPTNRILALEEKPTHATPGWINAGIYLFQREWLAPFARLPPPFSLERDLLPQLLTQRVVAFRHSGLFIDIGTKESYLAAQCRFF